MSSQKRIDSSRANGAKSRGPVTPEGRARSRAAGLTHGLTSSQLLLEGESEDQFNALREEYLAEYQPQTRSRFDLVDQLVAARWRHNRVLALQTALMDRQIANQEPEIRKEYKVCDAETRAAIAYQHLIDDSRALESFNRHETRLSAELRRTLKLLDAEIKNQKLHDEPSLAKPPHFDEDSPTPEAPRFPSTIDHPPSTGSDSPTPEAPRFPSTIDHPPSTGSDSPAPEAPRFPSAIDHPPSTGSDSPAPEAPRFPSAIDHPPSTAKAQLKNQKLHDEPSGAQPPHSHEDGPAAEASRSPSTIDHPPSTSFPRESPPAALTKWYPGGSK